MVYVCICLSISTIINLYLTTIIIQVVLPNDSTRMYLYFSSISSGSIFCSIFSLFFCFVIRLLNYFLLHKITFYLTSNKKYTKHIFHVFNYCIKLLCQDTLSFNFFNISYALLRIQLIYRETRTLTPGRSGIPQPDR